MITGGVTMRVANAPCSWGLIGRDRSQQPSDYSPVLDEIALAGYAGTELGDWGFMPTDPARLKKELAARKLEIVGAWVDAAFSDPGAHADGRARAVQTAKLLAATGNAPVIVLADANERDPLRTRLAGRIGPEHALDDARFRTFAAGVDEVARAVHGETGLRSVFHHHAAGWVETPDEIDRLLAATDERFVGLCLDTGHYAFGGGDPLAAYAKHASRVWHVHFKDFSRAVLADARASDLGYADCVKRGIFCELGKGVVDFEAMLGQLRARAYDGWIVVEQDMVLGLGAPLDCARQNRAYLQRLGV